MNVRPQGMNEKDEEEEEGREEDTIRRDYGKTGEEEDKEGKR